jgi:hypothetical protein
MTTEPQARDCPKKNLHTPHPELYLQHYSWAHEMSKTHAQITCESCGRWEIWLPKAQAREINKRRLREVSEFLKAHGLPKVKTLCGAAAVALAIAVERGK